MAGPSIHETLPTPLPPFIIGRFIGQPGIRARRSAAGGRLRSSNARSSFAPGLRAGRRAAGRRCGRAFGRARERIGRACLGPSWQRSRLSLAGCRAAAERRGRRGGVAADRTHRSILIRCRGRRAPLVRGGRHRRLRTCPQFREPDPERLPQHGRPHERRPGKRGPPVRERHGRDCSAPASERLEWGLAVRQLDLPKLRRSLQEL